MLLALDFRLARIASLSIGGWQPKNLARSLGGAADFCLTSFEVGGSALARTYGVSFPTTRSQQLAEGVSGVLSLWHFLAGAADRGLYPLAGGSRMNWRGLWVAPPISV